MFLQLLSSKMYMYIDKYKKIRGELSEHIVVIIS